MFVWTRTINTQCTSEYKTLFTQCDMGDQSANKVDREWVDARNRGLAGRMYEQCSTKFLFIFPPPNVLSSHWHNKPNVHCTYFTQCYSVHQMSFTQCHTQCPSPNVIPNVLHPMSYPMSFTQCHTQCTSPNAIPNVLHPMSYPMYFTQCHTQCNSPNVIPNVLHPMSYPIFFTQCTARLTTQSTQCHS
jgi:hypothetical protein